MVGKNKASIELYKKRVLEYPDDPDEYLLLIKVYLYADQVEEAKKAIDAVKKVDERQLPDSLKLSRRDHPNEEHSHA